MNSLVAGNTIFVSDLLQLQPANGNPVFERITHKALSYKLGCAASVNIWRDSVIYDELTKALQICKHVVTDFSEMILYVFQCNSVICQQS